MNKLIFGLAAAGIAVVATSVAMHFANKNRYDDDDWDFYDDDSFLIDGTEEILTPFSNDTDSSTVKGNVSPDVDNHQNDLA